MTSKLLIVTVMQLNIESPSPATPTTTNNLFHFPIVASSKLRGPLGGNGVIINEEQRIASFDLPAFVDLCLSQNLISAITIVFEVPRFHGAVGTFDGMTQIMIGRRVSRSF
jgi:hypothetical protein